MNFTLQNDKALLPFFLSVDTSQILRSPTYIELFT